MMEHADMDDLYAQGEEMLARQALIVGLLTRIADALDPPKPKPDTTSLYETRSITVERRRRPPIGPRRTPPVTKG